MPNVEYDEVNYFIMSDETKPKFNDLIDSYTERNRLRNSITFYIDNHVWWIFKRGFVAAFLERY